MDVPEATNTPSDAEAAATRPATPDAAPPFHAPASSPLPAPWLALLAAPLLAPSLWYPFGRDQGVFAYAGRVILRGGWPYRDVWDLKPPGIYYTYAAMLACTR